MDGHGARGIATWPVHNVFIYGREQVDESLMEQVSRPGVAVLGGRCLVGGGQTVGLR